MKQVMEYFGDIGPFLEANPELSRATRKKLLDILNDPQVKAHVQIELAAIVDGGEPFVKATYKLEGDGPLVLHCYEVLNTVATSIQISHYPNVHGIAQVLSKGSQAHFQQWVDYAKGCVEPGLQYFLDKFSNELRGCSRLHSCVCQIRSRK